MSNTPNEDLAEERPELEDKLSELEILRQSLEQSKAREKDVYDQLLRLTAEFQNFRKRSEGRISEARTMGREDVLLPIISLSDALAQAQTASLKATDTETLRRGLAMVKEQFEKFLSDQGLVAIPSKGEKMDPLKHEAIARVEDPHLEEGMVVDEIQRGYTLNNRLVRPSRVSVSAKPEEKIHTKETKGNKEEKHHG
jgi:molecular chaperone GrpE